MRTFKQFKVGEIEYELSYEAFTSVHKLSINRAYLRIVGKDREFAVEIPKDNMRYHWGWSGFIDKNIVFRQIRDKNKAHEIRRLIMLFLTNSL
jgi:hypothetical protein